MDRRTRPSNAHRYRFREVASDRSATQVSDTARSQRLFQCNDGAVEIRMMESSLRSDLTRRLIRASAVVNWVGPHAYLPPLFDSNSCCLATGQPCQSACGKHGLKY